MKKGIGLLVLVLIVAGGFALARFGPGYLVGLTTGVETASSQVLAVSSQSEDVSVAPQPKVFHAQQDFRGNWLIDTTFLLTHQNFSFDVGEDSVVADGSLNLRLRSYGTPIDPNIPSDPNDLSAWNFSVPGPTFWFPAPGPNRGGNPQSQYSDLRLRLALINNLTEGDSAKREDGCNASTADTDVAPNCFHGNNTTNIHYHGSHADPRQRGDNVLVKVKPGETFVNDFFFGINQSPGTHWYHPHKHGSTALQVANGLAGAVIIEGDLDVKSINPEAQDLVFMAQYVTDDLHFWTAGGGQPPQLIINGVFNPTVRMKPGEIQRWRIINANQNAQGFVQFRFGDVAGEFPTMYQIAQDGVQFSPERWAAGTKLNSSNPPLMAPGNRVDYLVVAPTEPGVYQIIAKPVQPQVANVRDTAVFDERAALTVVVEGDPVDADQWQLPDTLPNVPDFHAAITDDEITGDREIAFSMQGNPGNQPSFYIDGEQFEDGRIDQEIELGSVEEWKLVNESPVMHPFHIHINPFQVVAIYDPNAANEEDRLIEIPEELRQWQDTVALPPAGSDGAMIPKVLLNEDGSVANPGYVIIRHRFLDFAGDFVLHCHILGHEDRGMMQSVRVTK